MVMKKKKKKRFVLLDIPSLEKIDIMESRELHSKFDRGL